ncbi:MAG: tryptophan-rich sensory protein [Clostridiales bacterium]|nr:tryptophan-rich sensory protein [Clostridiales bacterium]
MKQHNWKGAVLSILLAELTGGLSVLLAGDLRGFYLSLEKPALAPPSWLFGLVWPILYALIGYAAYLVYLQRVPRWNGKRSALITYALALLLNFAWVIVFFGLHSLAGGLAVIAVLDLLAVFLFAQFFRINKTAACLILPYLIWLGFATYLNIGIVLLN